MEVTFQNKREDFQAFYSYMVKETEQGKMLSKLAFRNRIIWNVLISVLLGALVWGAYGKWQDGLGLAIFLFLAVGVLQLLISGFKPLYYAGVETYKRQEKTITPRDLQVFQLPRTITTDDNWLEIRSSEALHRWRWRRVDRIGITSNFIFIHVGNCPAVYVPKRDFPSEESFVEFGKKLVELKEKFKDQPIGIEQ